MVAATELFINYSIAIFSQPSVCAKGYKEFSTLSSEDDIFLCLVYYVPINNVSIKESAVYARTVWYGASRVSYLCTWCIPGLITKRSISKKINNENL